MKPHNTTGVHLENTFEISVAADAARFLGDLKMLPEQSQTAIDSLANVLSASRDNLEALATPEGDRGDVKISLDLDTRAETRMVIDALKVAAKHHPDQLTTDAAQEMLTSYNTALDTPPTVS